MDVGEAGEQADHGGAVAGGKRRQQAVLHAADGGQDLAQQGVARRGQAQQLDPAVAGGWGGG